MKSPRVVRHLNWRGCHGERLPFLHIRNYHHHHLRAALPGFSALQFQAHLEATTAFLFLLLSLLLADSALGSLLFQLIAFFSTHSLSFLSVALLRRYSRLLVLTAAFGVGRRLLVTLLAGESSIRIMPLSPETYFSSASEIFSPIRAIRLAPCFTWAA